MKLQRLTVNGRGHELRNIVVIVGPNNAGKTKLLEDLYYELTHSYDRTNEADYVYSSTQNTLWPQMTDKDSLYMNRVRWSNGSMPTNHGKNLRIKTMGVMII